MRIRRSGPPDIRSIGQAFAFPGSDPRTWLSYGTVDDEDPVQFDPDMGPMVNVILQPTNIQVRCRVGMTVAGNGEGEYTPFVNGDEVLVALPNGSTWAGAAIIGRFNNAVDKFPTGVGGQDASANTFAFKRVRTAYTLEAAGNLLFREATSGGFLSVDKGGVITLRDGQASALQLSPDIFGYQSGDAAYLMQLDLTGRRFTLQVDDSLLVVAGSKASPNQSAMVTPGTFSLSTSAQPATEHVLTTEAFCNLMVQVLTAIGAQNPGPILGASLAGIAPTAIAAALPLAAVAVQNPAIGAAINGAFAASTQKPAAVVGLGQTKPGIGCAGLLAG